MRDLAVLFSHQIATIARLAGLGGARSVMAESVLVKQQLLILNRSRKRSPNLRLADRIIVGVFALLMRPGRLIQADPFLDRPEILNALEPRSSADEAEVSPAVLAHGTGEAGPKGTHPGSHGRRRRHETAKFHLGVSTDRATDCPGLRDSRQQGCGAAHSRRSVPAEPRLGGAVLAHGPWSPHCEFVQGRLQHKWEFATNRFDFSKQNGPDCCPEVALR
jgi:hypothetical protein